MTCADLGPDLVAVALGQADAAESDRVHAHVQACAPCRDELAATRRLFGAAMAEALPACAAGAEDRLLAAIRDERNATSGSIPAPVARPRRAGRFLRLFVPLAAAAAVLVAITLTGREHPVEVVDGEGFLFARDGAGTPGFALKRGVEAFRFGEGDELASGKSPLSVRLGAAAGPAKSGDAQPQPGTVEIALSPGARIVRRAASQIELVAGSIDVAAGALAEPFVVSSPPNSATVRGTRFTASTAEKRLVVVVKEGSVEIASSGGRSNLIEAGHEGLIDADRLLTRASDGRGARQVFLTPRASLSLGESFVTASISAGEGGPVSILPFDDSEPRFLLRLKGDDGLEREVKLQRTMLTLVRAAGPEGLVRLADGQSYSILFAPSALGVAPGRYQATLRYVSYRARSDGTEWLGVVESEPLAIEVPSK